MFAFKKLFLAARSQISLSQFLSIVVASGTASHLKTNDFLYRSLTQARARALLLSSLLFSSFNTCYAAQFIHFRRNNAPTQSFLFLLSIGKCVVKLIYRVKWSTASSMLSKQSNVFRCSRSVDRASTLYFVLCNLILKENKFCVCAKKKTKKNRVQYLSHFA